MAVEAVIISGPRKGELILVPEDVIAEPSAAAVDALNAALKELDAALVATIEESRAWRAALHGERKEAPNG